MLPRPFPISDDELTRCVVAAMALAGEGDRCAARESLAELWKSADPEREPYQASVIAHYLADLQDDLGRELELDRLALQYALRCTDARVRAHHPSLSVAVLLPSLWLNLADSLHRSGRSADALRAVSAGEAALRSLPANCQPTVAYGLEGLRERLAGDLIVSRRHSSAASLTEPNARGIPAAGESGSAGSPPGRPLPGPGTDEPTSRRPGSSVRSR